MKQHFVNQQTLKQLGYDNGLDLVPTWELDENLQTRYALIGFKSEAQINHVMSLCDNFERVVIVRKPFDNCWRLSDFENEIIVDESLYENAADGISFCYDTSYFEDLLQDEMYMEADGVDEHSVCEIIERIQALKPGEVVVVAGNDHFVETLQTHVLNYRDSNGWLWAVALR